MLFNVACPLFFPCHIRCVIWMLHCCSKYHTPIFHRWVYLQIPLWILMCESWETGTELPRAQQSTEVTKWVDVNSSDHEQSLSNALRFGHACRAVNKHTSKNLVTTQQSHPVPAPSTGLLRRQAAPLRTRRAGTHRSGTCPTLPAAGVGITAPLWLSADRHLRDHSIP